jgi:hypothetical protein
MSVVARQWFTVFGAVGIIAGVAAAVVLWLLVTQPIGVAQAFAGWP